MYSFLSLENGLPDVGNDNESADIIIMSWSPHINTSFQSGIIVLCAVLSPIAPVVVGLRLWSRSILRSHLLWGDILIVLSCVCLNKRRAWNSICGAGIANWEAGDSFRSMATHHFL